MAEENGQKRQRMDVDAIEKVIMNDPTEIRPPLTRTHKIIREDNKHHLLLILTGSIALMNTSNIINSLYKHCGRNKLVIKVVATENAIKLCRDQKIEIDELIYEDRDGWSMLREQGDPVLHIELGKWADSCVIAPLNANTMAKIANGLCDNLVTSIIRAWDSIKPCYYAPAINIDMWESPVMLRYRTVLAVQHDFKEVCPSQKKMMCEEEGYGAMSHVGIITTRILALIDNQLAFRSREH